MRAHIISSIFTILFISGAGFAQVENPTPVTVCELKKNPDAYNHNLVRVQGAIDHEFEDFSIDDHRARNTKARRG